MIDFKARSFLFFFLRLISLSQCPSTTFSAGHVFNYYIVQLEKEFRVRKIMAEAFTRISCFYWLFFFSLVMCFWHFKKLLVCLNVIQSSLTLKKPCGVGEGRPVQCWLFPFLQWPKTSFSTFLSFISKMVIAMPALNCHRIVVRLK